MPKLMGQSASLVGQTVSSFGYSGKRAEDLTETEYTVTDLEIDISPSTSPFLSQLTKGLVTVHGALQKCPRAKQMLVRVGTFDETLREVHGFINLADIDPAGYNLTCVGGGTALYDAALSSVEALEAECARLYSLDFGVNALGIHITDGEDVASRIARNNPGKVKLAKERALRAEKAESVKLILVGVGQPDDQDDSKASARTQKYLEDYSVAAGYDQYIWIGAANPQNIAKLAGFVSKSVVSSSNSLGTGGPSQNLSF